MILFAVFVESASANFKPYQPPQITVLSPSPNGTSYSSNVPLNVKIQLFGYTPQSLEHLDSLNYSLDGQEDVTISFDYPSSYSPGYYLYGNGTLSGLSQGVHNLTVRGESTIGAEKKYFDATVSFAVDTSAAPFGELSSIFPIVPVSVAMAAIVVGVLVCVKKRKR
jgi:hypothetical protein